MDDIRIILSKLVNKTADCWLWLGQIDVDGFARFRSKSAARFVYQNLVRPIAPQMLLKRLCKNHSCVNPDHLQPMTRREHALTGTTFAAKNAQKCRCPRGHTYSSNNVFLYTAKDGKSRLCRTCLRERARLRRDQKLINETLVLEAFNHTCFKCGSQSSLCLDHHRPFIDGHQLTLNNVTVLCRSCNSRKYTSLPEQFYSQDELEKLKLIHIKLYYG